MKTTMTLARVLGVAAAAAVATGCTSSSSNTDTDARASTQRLGNGTYNFGTLASPGKCLDVDGAGSADGTHIQEWTCNGTSAQSFRVEDVGGGLVRLVNTGSGKCVDVAGGDTKDGTNIHLWTCNGTGAQTFRLDDLGSADVVIVNVQSGKCIDVANAGTADGTNVQLWSCNQSKAQIWQAAAIDAPPPAPSPEPQPAPPQPTPPAPPNGTLPGWNLVWSDEFDGDTIDESKWGYEVQGPGWVNNELEAYTDHRRENARVENGHLVIEGRHDGFGGEYSSARLKTQGKASWTYGRVEASIQLPGGLGSWPAFWMMPEDFSRGWPACGEIDIMEEVGYDLNSVHATTHSAAYNWKSSNQRTAATSIDNATGAFHTYAMEWYPDRIDMFVDGTKYFTSGNDNTGDDAWPFDKPFYVILNLAIGGDWGGAQGVDPNAWPRQMLIDYVRVYQK